MSKINMEILSGVFSYFVCVNKKFENRDARNPLFDSDPHSRHCFSFVTSKVAASALAT